MALTQQEIDELVRQMAVPLGIDPQAPDVRDQVLRYNVENAPSQVGLFTPVYQKVVGWISDTDQEGNPIPEAGVEASAWTFLRAAANVNFGDTLDAYMAREYTGIQYNLRIGELSGQALADKVYQMSNGIAINIMKQIISSNGVVPTINQIGDLDARVVVDEHFGGDKAGWVGNALFHYFGTDQFFEVLDPATSKHGTYDIIASMYAMQKPLRDASFFQLFQFWRDDTDPQNEYSRAFVMAQNTLGTAGTLQLMQGLSATLDGWFSQNYYGGWSGLFNTFYNPSLGDHAASEYAPTVEVGKLHVANTLDLTSVDSQKLIARGGEQDDVFKIDRIPDAILDGGKGTDQLDMSEFQFFGPGVTVEITSKEQRNGNQALEITSPPTGTVSPFFPQTTSYAYNFEKLKLSDVKDVVELREEHVPSLIELDTGGGDDQVQSTVRDLRIDLGAGNDVLALAGVGSIVYTGAGADIVNFSAGALIDDAGSLDRVVVGGNYLNNAITYGGSESGWAYFNNLGGAVRAAYNSQGQLGIQDAVSMARHAAAGAGADETDFIMFLSNFNADPLAALEERRAGIRLANVEISAYRLIKGPSPEQVALSQEASTWDLMAQMLQDLGKLNNVECQGIDPLALDLDGDGLELSSRGGRAPYFDVDGDGFRVWMWPLPEASHRAKAAEKRSGRA